jgi:acetolactate decarboxylase
MNFFRFFVLLFVCACAVTALKSHPQQTLLYTSGLKHTLRLGLGTSNYKINELDQQSGVYMLGPSEGFLGEVTIVNGKIHHSYMEDEQVMTSNQPVDMVFNVYARCSDFKALETGLIKDIPSLEAALSEVSTEPLLFKFSAHFMQLRAHIVNGLNPSTKKPDKKFIDLDQTRIEGVGFFSKNHHRIFTHHDSDVHIHIIDPNGHTFHLDSFQSMSSTKIEYCKLRTKSS